MVIQDTPLRMTQQPEVCHTFCRTSYMQSISLIGGLSITANTGTLSCMHFSCGDCCLAGTGDSREHMFKQNYICYFGCTGHIVSDEQGLKISFLICCWHWRHKNWASERQENIGLYSVE